MNMNFCRKILMVFLPFITVGIIKILNIDLIITFIYPIAEQVKNHNMIILAALLISGVVGLTFKNRKTYYMFWVNIELILSYICFASYYLTDVLSFKNNIELSLSIIFLLFATILFLLQNNTNKIIISEQRGILNPINKHYQLYNCRINQMKCLNQIIQGDTSNYGYSICISGEWGCGKTSFINAALDKINIDIKNKTTNLKVHSIMINTMELDNLDSLVTYFFNRIKDILKDYNVYVGINSEYQELVNSFIGVIINETTGNFIKNNFTENTDYRENITYLNNIINKELKNSKIIIIVDDLDRCSKEKALMFLFFIKEIAMLNRCIIIFLTDYDELLIKCEIKNAFLEKFFNYRINLCKISESDIIKSINDAVFEKELNKCKAIFENEIEKINKRKVYTHKIEDTSELKKQKEEAINSIKKNYNLFIKLLFNPRKIILIHEKFTELLFLTYKEKLKKEYVNYSKYIDKVEYKYQIFILSLLFGIYPDEYKLIETEGIFNFISQLEDKRDNNEKSYVDLLIEKEWYNNVENYIANEKLQFINSLLTRPEDLLYISSPYTSLQEMYIDNIKHNKKPNGISFSNLIEELLSAKFKTVEEKATCIENTFKLYKNDLYFDEALEILMSRYSMHQIADGFYFLKIFYNNFCDLLINNLQKCVNDFIYFSQHYLLNKLLYISRYIIISYEGNISDWNDVAECVFNINNCNKMITAYCDIATQMLKINNIEQGDSINTLKQILKYTDDYCKNESISDCDDIKANKYKAEKTIDCFEYLLKIEEYIKKYDSPSQKLIINDDYSQSLSNILNFIKETDDNTLSIKLYDISNLFYNIIYSKAQLSKEDLININSIIEVIHKKLGHPVIDLRKMYVIIKKNNLNCNSESKC